MEISFANVYGENGKPSTVALSLLYAMLEERGPEVNISHRKMPSWEQHVAFVSARPHPYWFLIYDKEWVPAEGSLDSDTDDFDEYCIGQIYLTNLREIGIQLFRHKHIREGYGTAAVTKLMELVQPRGPFFANVSPKNKVSQAFFESMGFSVTQWTYRLDPVFFDEPLYAGHPATVKDGDGFQKYSGYQTLDIARQAEEPDAIVTDGVEIAKYAELNPEQQQAYRDWRDEIDEARETVLEAGRKYAERKTAEQEKLFRGQHDGTWEVPVVKPRPEGE
jgi:RimJ/RimL family protein N-acetyltransferase